MTVFILSCIVIIIVLSIRKTILSSIVTAFILAAFLLLSTEKILAATGINKQINFQGKVVNSNGTNFTNGDYSFLFCIYTMASPTTACTAAANNDAIWRESKTLTVTDGIFRTQLGDTTALPGSVDFNTDNIYLGTNFNSDGQMTPLVRFTAVPYAFNALKVAGLTVTDTTGTFTLTAGKTLTVNNTLTFAGTDSTTITFQGTDTYVGRATTDTLTNKTIGTTGLVFSGATTDITTATGEDLTLLANGAGVLKLGDFTTANGVLYVSATDGTVAETAASTGAQCLQTSGAGTAPIWGSCSGAGGGITTVRESDLTPSVGSLTTLEFGPATTSEDEFIVTDQTGGVARVVLGSKVGKLNEAETVTAGWTFNTAATTFTTAINANGGLTTSTADTALAFTVNGAGDYTFAGDSDSNFQLNATPTTDATFNSAVITLNPTGTGSTGTLQGLLISQSDNANTGVYDSLLKLENLKTPETTENGLFIQHNAASGTLTNAINITNTAGTLTTGLSLTGTFTNLISHANFSVTNAGLITTAGALAVNGDSITADGATLTINAAGAVDIQDNLTADQLTTDVGGVSIAAAQSYTGAGAVTLSSGGGLGLTLDSASNTLTIASSDTSLSATGLTTVTLGAGATITTSSGGNLIFSPNGAGDISITTDTDTALDVTRDDSSTNTQIELSRFTRTTSGTAANNIGAHSGYFIESSNGANIEAGRAGFILRDATNPGTPGGEYVVSTWRDSDGQEGLWEALTAYTDGSNSYICGQSGRIAGTSGPDCFAWVLGTGNVAYFIFDGVQKLGWDYTGANQFQIFTSDTNDSLRVKTLGTQPIEFDTSNDGVDLTIDSSGNLAIAANKNLTLASGTGVFSQTHAVTTDATADAHTITLSAGGTGSTGTLRGLVVTQADTVTTGVYDSLVHLINQKTPETTTNGLLIEQNAASGTLTNGIQVLSTAGTLTSGILIADGAGTTTTGLTMTGTFTNLIDTPTFDVSNAGTLSIATGQSYTGTGTVTLSSAAASGLTINSGTTGTLAIGDDASAETINIGTGGAAKTVVLGSTNTTSTTTVQSGSGNINLQANNTSTGNVQIGDGGATSATPDLLVMDIGSAEPTGTNGAIYYSTATNTFRCFENSAWKNCDTTGAGAGYMDLLAESTLASAANNITLTIAAREFVNCYLSTKGNTATAVTWLRFNSDAATNYDYQLNYNIATAFVETQGLAQNQIVLDTTDTESWHGQIQFANFSNARKSVWMRANRTDATTGPDNFFGSGNWNNTAAQITTVAFLTSTSTFLAGSHAWCEGRNVADYAENYYSKDLKIEAGDIVTHDPSLPAGIQKATKPYDPKLIGAISTNPGIVLDEGIGFGRGWQYPVALSGRIPVKVSTINGPIKSGDLLTSSTISGVAMKATKAGAVIGQALESYDGEGVGKVLTFVKTSYYNGVSSADLISGSGDMLNTDQKTRANARLLDYLANEKLKYADDAALSEVTTDRVVAGLEVITPKILADEIEAKTITAGLVIADKIKANQIEGLEIFTNRISSLEGMVAGLSTSSVQTIDDGGIEDSILKIDNGGSNEASPSSIFDPQSSTINFQSSTVNVLNLNANGGLVVLGPSEFRGESLFDKLATFISHVIFKDDVTFLGRPTFNKDTAGFALIKKGDRKVKVEFEKEYKDVPIVTVNRIWEIDDKTLSVIEKLDGFFQPKYEFSIAGVTTKGFTIVLEELSVTDLKFNWVAIAVDQVKTYESTSSGQVAGASFDLSQIKPSPWADNPQPTTHNLQPTASSPASVISTLIPTVTNVPTTPIATVSPTTIPTSAPQKTITLLPNEYGFVRLRETPTIEGIETDRLETGANYPYLEKRYDWYQIKTGDKTGWVSGTYVSEN